MNTGRSSDSCFRLMGPLVHSCFIFIVFYSPFDNTRHLLRGLRGGGTDLWDSLGGDKRYRTN